MRKFLNFILAAYGANESAAEVRNIFFYLFPENLRFEVVNIFAHA